MVKVDVIEYLKRNLKPDPYWQSYFMDIPYDTKKKTCDSYWEYKQKGDK